MTDPGRPKVPRALREVAGGERAAATGDPAAGRPRRGRAAAVRRRAGGGAGAGLRRAVLAADRPPDPRVRGVRRAAAARHRARHGSASAPRGARPLGRARVGLLGGSAPSCDASCSSSASRCSASATGCRRWSRCSAAGSREPRPGEFGRTALTLADGGGRLLAGLPDEQQCWMSHRDAVFEPPPGLHRARLQPGLAGRRLREPRSRPLRHPVPPGGRPHPLRHRRSSTASCARSPGCEQRWSPASVIDEQVERIRAQVGDAGVVCGLSGGVDSATAAALVHRAVGDQLTCVLVDHGLMRKNEAAQVVEAFRDRGHEARRTSTPQERFLDAARRRRRPGAQAQDHRRGVHPRLRGGGRASSPDARFLVQGTLYSDVIESGGDGRAGGDDQVAPQRRRPPRGPRARAGRAAADAVQGRGARRRDRARPAGAHRLAPAVPGPRPRRSASSAAR